MSKLGQILLVLLSSDQPGEIANAAALVRKELEKAGRDIHWLAEQLERIIKAPAVREHTPSVFRRHRMGDPGEWWVMLEFCITKLLFLDERESEFIESLMDQWTNKSARWVPSAKQLRWLTAIYNRLQAGDPFGRW